MDEIEIPEAIREGVDLPDKSRFTLSVPLIVGGILGLGIVGLLSFVLLNLGNKPSQKATSGSIEKQAAPKARSEVQTKRSSPTNKNAISAQEKPKKKVVGNRISKDNLLGHLPYDIAPQAELISISNDGRLTLRSAAAVKFKQMQSAARADGINLVPISAFRTTEAQEQLFFGIKEQRVQNAAKRAKVSAPPGYSEHHTGYALDIGDGNAPTTHVEATFANTVAFKWLKQNALKYSFELSFPPNNDQGVSYEPWHWRFVGDRDSLETFYKVRN